MYRISCVIIWRQSGLQFYCRIILSKLTQKNNENKIAQFPNSALTKKLKKLRISDSTKDTTVTWFYLFVNGIFEKSLMFKNVQNFEAQKKNKEH